MKISHEGRKYVKGRETKAENVMEAGVKEKADEFTRSGCRIYQDF